VSTRRPMDRVGEGAYDGGMPGRALCLGLMVGLAIAVSPVWQARAGEGSLRVGGMPVGLVAGRGFVWALTCDRGCSGEARQSVGRIIRIDPRSGRVTASAALRRPGALAVGSSGVYAVDFWHDTVRRIDPRTLAVVSALKLMLPFQFSARDSGFAPSDVAVGAGGVWIATARCAIAHADPRASSVLATVLLPCDALGGIAVDARAVWVGESLLGVYRVDPRTNRVVARIPIGPAATRFSVDQVMAGAGNLFAIGTWTTAGNVGTESRGLARIDSGRTRLAWLSKLPSGPLAATFGQGSVWVGRVGGSEVERIDPTTGQVAGHLHLQVGTMLAVAGGQLWTADRDGAIRRLAIT
jgi:virginiamycin B lyase